MIGYSINVILLFMSSEVLHMILVFQMLSEQIASIHFALEPQNCSHSNNVKNVTSTQNFHDT